MVLFFPVHLRANKKADGSGFEGIMCLVSYALHPKPFTL